MATSKLKLSTRRGLQLALVAAGALAGAAFGLVLTRLGKIVAGAPPATLANYLWNATVFGVLAGIVSPLVTWSTLRRAPLWRTIAEPLVAACGAGSVAVVVGAPLLLLVLPPVGLTLGFLNLRRRYPEPAQMITQSPDARGLNAGEDPDAVATTGVASRWPTQV